MVRGSRAGTCLLLLIICSLSVRTASYNDDLLLSAESKGNKESDAYNYYGNCTKAPVKQRPVQTQKPRALASITLPMAQTQHSLRREADDFAEPSPFAAHNDLLDLHTPSVVPLEQAACRACLSAPPPDFCSLHAVFRI